MKMNLFEFKKNIAKNIINKLKFPFFFFFP